jgi:hypothetical protein
MKAIVKSQKKAQSMLSEVYIKIVKKLERFEKVSFYRVLEI